jgi:hypothetical protein
MAKQKAQGICRICGLLRELTYEHIPPRCAFNQGPARMYSIEQWVVLESGGPAKHRYQQRGSGYVTLCAECNNRRGGTWNVPDFCLWARTGDAAIARFPDGETVTKVSFRPTKELRPLPFAKQIVSMMLALNEPAFGVAYPDLRKFVMDKERVGLPDDHRIYLSLCDIGFARWVGRYDFLGITLTGDVETVVATELSYYPFTYVLSIGPPLRMGELADVTEFAHLARSNFVAEKLTIPVNGSFLPFDIP